MASLDSLPPDQRAVLQLVLQRGRSYDQIAQMLSIDRAAVRERALNAFDALGPETRVPAEQRALITDYLLGQLPEKVAENTHQGLASSANERAWARVVASELGTLAAGPLPEIPTEGAPAPEPEPVAPEPEAAPDTDIAAATETEAAPAADTTAETPPAAEPTPESPVTEPVAAAPAQPDAQAPAEETPSSGRRRLGRGGAGAAGAGGAGHPVSRRDGAILLGGGAILIIAIVVAIILISSGGDSHPKTSTTTAVNASTTTAPQTSTSTTASSTATIKPLAQVTLTSPQAGSKTKGVAIVVRQGTTTAIELAAQAVPANTSHDAYAVWLYNSPSDATLLGFVNPGVKSDGVLRTLGRLPANASHFRQLLVTRETQAKPHAPGTIVLQGALNLPSA
jgi:hypothetical protein